MPRPGRNRCGAIRDRPASSLSPVRSLSNWAGEVVASTSRALRVLETSHPPTYHLPRQAFADGVLREASGSSWCEWKGQSTYYDLLSGTTIASKAAWSYLNPTSGFASIAGAVAVMAAKVDRCTVNGEVVVPQPGGFYGLDHQLDHRSVQRRSRIHRLVTRGSGKVRRSNDKR